MADVQFVTQMQRITENAVIEVERATFWLAIGSAISTAVFLWLLYWIIRCAVRDGMKDASASRPANRAGGRPLTRDRDRIEGPDLRTD